MEIPLQDIAVELEQQELAFALLPDLPASVAFALGKRSFSRAIVCRPQRQSHKLHLEIVGVIWKVIQLHWGVDRPVVLEASLQPARGGVDELELHLFFIEILRGSRA